MDALDACLAAAASALACAEAAPSPESSPLHAVSARAALINRAVPASPLRTVPAFATFTLSPLHFLRDTGSLADFLSNQ
ncbi:hypothetical protein GCM10027168_35380 [Streptomyces capparidis]